MDEQTYGEGDVFGVPLDDGGYGIGLVARARKGMVLGYFFDGIHQVPPALEDLQVHRDDAIEVMRFGDDGLRDGSWPILGQLPGWDRNAWPMPWFVNGNYLGEKSRILGSYYPDDPTRSLGYWKITPEQAEGLPPNGVCPWRAQEIGINKLLHHTPHPLPRVRIIPGPAAPSPKPAAVPVEDPAPEEAVRVYFTTPEAGLPARTAASLEAVEDGLNDLLKMKRLGYVDGTEDGQGEHVLYLYGPDRQRLWEETRGWLNRHSPIPPTSVYLREADLDATPIVIDLTDRA